jgi:Cdc6-like AAA superfamily ATPase
MLSFNECWNVIEGSSQGKNFSIWGNQGIGKTFTVKNLLKEINVESVYLDLEYPFDLNMLFQVIPMSFGIYYQQNWVNIVEQIGSKNRVLVIDNFDRLALLTNSLADDLSRLDSLAKLDSLSLIVISRMHLQHFHFSYFVDNFKSTELTEENTWKFGV